MFSNPQHAQRSSYVGKRRALLLSSRSINEVVSNKKTKQIGIPALSFFLVLGIAVPGLVEAQSIEAKVVPEAVAEPLLPWEPEFVNVKITYTIDEDMANAINELSQEADSVVASTATPALAALAASKDTAVNAINAVAKETATVKISNVATADAKAYQKGDLSQEGLTLKYKDSIEVIEESPVLDSPEAEVEASAPEVDITNISAASTASPDALSYEVDEDGSSVVTFVNSISASEITTLSEFSTLSATLKEAKDKLTGVDLVLAGVSNDLTALSDEELDTVNAESPSDAVTSEYLRRISEKGYSGLADYSNGLVDTDLLTPLSWDPEYVMQSDAAKMFELLNRDFKRDNGYDLKIISTYRPLSAQYEVRANDPFMTATPGYSNHGYGLAVDIGWSSYDFVGYDSVEYNWMMKNGYKYGWLHPYWARAGSSMPEPWHFEFGTFYPNATESSPEFENETLPEYRSYWLTYGEIKN